MMAGPYTMLSAGGGSNGGASAAGTGAAVGGPVAIGAMAAFQVWSGIQQGAMIRRQSKISQQLAEMNAKFAEYDAWEAEKAGYSEMARYQTMIDSTVAQQRVGYATQGVDTSTGTAAEIISESEFTGYLNMLDIQNAARAQARGLKVQASNYRLGGYMQGVQGEVAATSAQISGYGNAASTAISGYARRGR